MKWSPICLWPMSHTQMGDEILAYIYIYKVGNDRYGIVLHLMHALSKYFLTLYNRYPKRVVTRVKSKFVRLLLKILNSSVLLLHCSFYPHLLMKGVCGAGDRWKTFLILHFYVPFASCPSVCSILVVFTVGFCIWININCLDCRWNCCWYWN